MSGVATDEKTPEQFMSEVKVIFNTHTQQNNNTTTEKKPHENQQKQNPS